MPPLPANLQILGPQAGRNGQRRDLTGLCYVRFMDDWVVLAPTRWKLRKAIALVNQTLAELRVEQHPDTTFIGRISHGFDFLGYHFAPDGVTMAAQTVANCVQRIGQLYEQVADDIRIGQYVRRWVRWAKPAGLTLRDGVAGIIDLLCRAATEEGVTRELCFAWFAPVDEHPPRIDPQPPCSPKPRLTLVPVQP